MQIMEFCNQRLHTARAVFDLLSVLILGLLIYFSYTVNTLNNCVYFCTDRFNVKKFYILLTGCIYVFSVDLEIK
jgi:hypothetical protein